MKKKIIGIFTTCILIAIISIAGIAYAKYKTSLIGNATAEIAKWSFKVNGQTDENFTIDLATTRTGIEQEANVQEGFVGPGTAGAFEIEIDARDTEVSLVYDINMDVDDGNNEKLPKNLIFYSDAEMKNAIYHTDNFINLNGFIAHDDDNKVKKQTIYWKWDYETGQTQEEKDSNDIADSLWMGKSVSLSIGVIGKQANESPASNQYAVTFDANGGTLQGYGNSSQATRQVKYGEQYGDLPTPVREGYTFKGWNGKNKINYSEGELMYSSIIDGKVVLDASSLEGNIGRRVDIQKYNNNSFIGTIFSSYENRFHSCTFVKDNTFDNIRLKINTTKSDPYIQFFLTNLTNGEDYTISFNVESKAEARAVISNIQLENGTVATKYEPYYITSSTEVVQNQNHTLTAIWEPISNNP